MAGYDFDTSAALSAMGSVGATALNVAANGDIGRRNRKFYREERLATQEYNTSERLAAQQYNYERWLEATRREEAMYNKYSSPAALKRQYLEAGLNPLLAADNNSVGNVSTSSQAAPSHPQSSTPIQSSGAAIPYFNMAGISEGFVNVATALKGIADARKAGVDTNRVEALLDKELESWDLSNKEKSLIYSVDLATLSYKKVLELKTALAQLRLTDKSIEEKEKIIQGLVKDNIIKQNEVDTWLEMFDVNKAKTESETNLNNASAGERSAAAVNHRAQANLANHQAGYYDVLKKTEKCRQRLLNEQRFNVHENTAVQHYQNRILRLTYEVDSLASRVFVKNFDQYSKNEKQKLKNDYISLRSQYTKLRGEAVHVGADAGFDPNFNDYLNASWDALDETFGTFGKIFNGSSSNSNVHVHSNSTVHSESFSESVVHRD